MRKRVLILGVVFALLNSAVVYAEEVYEEQVEQPQKNEQNLMEETEKIEESEDVSVELIQEDSEEAETKAKIYRGWYYEKKSGKWFCYNQKGKMQYGWLKYKGDWYYLDKSSPDYPGAMSVNCKLKINSETYFFDGDGVMLTGWVKRPEGWYYTDKSGAMRTGWQKISGKWYYLDAGDKKYPGIMHENCKSLINNKNYIFNKSGGMLNGWIRYSRNWYYADKNGAVQSGWRFLNKKWYYLNPLKDQKMAVGWAKIDNTWYYMNKSGVMQSGWKKISGKWYYMNKNGAIQTGWQKVDRKWYYMDESGEMQTGWQKVDGKWYYMNRNGVMQTGWQKLGGKWYYLGVDGGVRTGWKKLGDSWYYFYKKNDTYGCPECAMAVNKSIEGWTITESGEAYYKNDVERKIEEIKKYIYVPYRLGGDSPSGWDCSGFTKWALKYIGVSIPKTTITQYAGGKSVNKNNKSTWRPGDILIYSKGGRVNHVALYLGNDMLMHALNTKYGTLIQQVDYYEKWDHGNNLYAVKRYL